MKKFQHSETKYRSNCFVEAMKAKIKNPKEVKVYFCKPQFIKHSKFKMPHFMWSDGKYDFDFSCDRDTLLHWYECFWFTGRIKRYKLGFAKRLLSYQRNLNRKNKKYWDWDEELKEFDFLLGELMRVKDE